MARDNEGGLSSDEGGQRANNPSLRENHARRPRNPGIGYSLAGNTAFPNHGSYVDPKYHQLNPNYQKLKDQPLWGLAKPLPRVIRPGMTRKGHGGDVVEREGAEVEPPGSAEVIPQIGMIGDQRQDAGLEVKKSKRSQRTEDRGYGHQNEQRVAQRTRSGDTRTEIVVNQPEQSFIDQYGSPNEEKDNPMDDWSARLAISQAPSPFEDAHGDIGANDLGRLSSVKEESISNLTTPSNFRSLSRNAALDDDIDLEAGDQPNDWPVSDEEAKEFMIEEHDNYNQWALIRAKFREPLAECLATCIAVLIGLCTNLSVTTSSQTAGSYFSKNWGWGLGITIGIYIAGGISGGHLNPAISLMLSLYRGFPIRKALVYISAQLLGAFFAGLIAYGIYRDAILSFDSIGGDSGGSTPVAIAVGNTGIAFYTQPASFTTPVTAFFNEFVATAVLSCVILALGDDSNAPPGAGMHAFIVGLLVTALTMAFGYNTGACLNPARDFGPRAAAAVMGYGRQVWVQGNVWWLWGACGATISGALIGGLAYDGAVFVGGESPVNYPRGKRKMAERKVKEEARWRWSVFKRGIRDEREKK